MKRLAPAAYREARATTMQRREAKRRIHLAVMRTISGPEGASTQDVCNAINASRNHVLNRLRRLRGQGLVASRDGRWFAPQTGGPPTDCTHDAASEP